jgi:hypothetical protein
MTSPITLVEIGGNAIDFENVEYSIYLTHGRGKITDGPTPSSASITIIAQESMPAVSIGDILIIEAHSLPRFRGQITDLTITHVKDGYARISIQATGIIAQMGNRYVPIYYPSSTTVFEAVKTQVLQSIPFGTFPIRPFSQNVMGGRDQNLNIVDPAIMNPPSALSYVGSTADWIGGAVVDYPDGNPLIQFYDSRGIVPYQKKWQDYNSFGETWSVQIGDWTQQTITYPTAEAPVVLDPDIVFFEPIWNQQFGELINSVSIGYGTSGGGPGPGPGGGGGGSTFQTDDAASIAQFGVRQLSLSTELANLGDAVVRATSILVRQSQPRWQLGGVEILMDEITDTAIRDSIMELICGRRVELNNLPTPGPYQTYVAIVEGWGEVFIGNGRDKGIHRMTLALSDPLLSYAVMPWSSLTTQTWDTINPSVIWADAISLDTLI